MQLFPLKSLVFVVHFLNAFWHGNETFPKGSSQYEIVPLLVVFHLPYSKYKGVKICFYSCRYQNQNFSLVSHSCRLCITRVALVPLVQHSCHTSVALVSHSCLTRVSLVSLVSQSCCIRAARVALGTLVTGTGVVNQTRYFLKPFMKYKNSENLFSEFSLS